MENLFNNLKELINYVSNEYSDSLAFIKGEISYGRDVTYKEFKKEIDCLGTSLINLGLKDKCIAVIGENRYEWTLSYLGITNGTGIVVPIDAELTEQEISNLLNRCEAAAIIFSNKVSEKVAKALENTNSVKYKISMDNKKENGSLNLGELLKLGEKLIKTGNDTFINADIDNEKLSILLFTSGTTGNAKGVMLSHKNITSNVLSIMQLVDIKNGERMLSILPLHHTYECSCGFLTPIAFGATIGFCRGLRYIGKDIQSVKPHILVLVPLIIEKTYAKIMDGVKTKSVINRIVFHAIHKTSPILKRIWGLKFIKKVFAPIYNNLGGQLRLIITGASYINPKVVKGFFNLGITVLQGYGLTECSPLVLGNYVNDYNYSSIGKTIPNVVVKIDSDNSKVAGEILVKGPNVMLGYYKDKESTDKVMVDGWFKTGDIGLIKRNGFVFMTGRKKNIIVTKTGKNIYPEEIEFLLNKSELILESVVTSSSAKIKEDNSILAIIVPDIEKIKSVLRLDTLSQIDIKKIIDDEIKKINKQMPIYKKIQDFHIRMEEFQKTTTRKIQRYKVVSNNK